MKFLTSTNKILGKLAEVVVSGFLLINVFVVFVGVFYRYVLNQPLRWVYEITIYLMMWSAFIGSSVVTRKREHISVDFIKKLVPLRYKKLLLIVGEIITLVFIFIIIRSGISMIDLTRGSRTPALELPVIWVYLAIPIGFILIFLQTLEVLLKDISVAYKLFMEKDRLEENE